MDIFTLNKYDKNGYNKDGFDRNGYNTYLSISTVLI